MSTPLLASGPNQGTHIAVPHGTIQLKAHSKCKPSYAFVLACSHHCRYVHLRHGVTPKMLVYANQIPPGTSILFATRYPPGV